MNDLQNQNGILQTISSQVIRLEGQYSQADRPHTQLPFYRRLHLRKFELIRTASCRLHEALSRACSVHKDHAIKFCLEATCTESDTENGFHICFNLAYSPLSATDFLPTSSTQLSVSGKEKGDERSQLGSNITAKARMGGGSQVEAASTPSLPGMDSTDIKWCEVESLVGSSNQTVPHQAHQAIAPNPLQQEGHGAHDHASGLCVELQTSINKDFSLSGKKLVLVLDKTDFCEHRVYYPSGYESPGIGKRATSLIDLLSTSSDHPVGSIPQLHKIRIARSLVVAVLQFHATPWLTESWQSQHLLFNGVISDTWQSYNPSPHLVVHVTPPSKQTLEPITTTQTHQSAGALVPNLMLFNLGVMLLELAYGVPFSVLNQSTSVHGSEAGQLAEFSAAYSFARNVGIFLGSAYADIVRKCLRCDFGEGEDLGSPALQERLYEDVVCKLEELEKGIRRSQGAI